MRTILKNEALALTRNRAVIVISLGFVLTLIVSVLMGNKQVSEQSRSYTDAKNHLRTQWEAIESMNPHSAAHYGTYVFKPSNLLTALDDGINSVTGNVLRVEGHVQNEMAHSEASQMIWASKFGKLKTSLLLQYIVPLILIFLAFRTVNSEQQSERLKLLIIQGTGATRLVFGKTLAVWSYGLSLLLLVILVYGFLNVSSLSNDIVLRTGLFFVAYGLYYFIICGLTIFLTMKWQKSAMALTSMLALWILWTIFIPNISMSLSEKWHPLPSRSEFQLAMKDDRSKGIDGHNPSDARGDALKAKVLKEYGVDSISQLPINFDGLRMQADEEYGNLVWDKHFGNLREVLAKQKKSVQLAGICNPFISMHGLSMGFAGNDNLHHQEFLLQVENYRRVFIKDLNDKHAFGGSKSGDWGWKADNDFFKSVADFNYKSKPIKSVISKYVIDAILIGFWSLLVLVLLVTGSKKMRVL